jgi:hypothetical protein
MEARSTVVAGEIQNCSPGVRSVPPEVDFVYIMRRDSDYVAAQIAARLGIEETVGEIRAAYDDAVDALAVAIMAAFRSVYERPAVDLLDAREIDGSRRELIASLGAATVISMDPLMEEGALPLAFSRCYLPGGIEYVEMIPRPGYLPLEEQVAAITAAAGSGPIVVVEDDFFSGETLRTMLGTYLGALADNVIGVVVGTKVGLLEPDFAVLPAVRYVCEDDRDPLEKIDLGDPRDYVVGASGLVCRLSSGRLGRLPYILPFVSPAARASIPKTAERELSAAAFELSRRFYEELGAIAGGTIALAAADPAFAYACKELLDLDSRMPIVDALDAMLVRGMSLVG